MSYIKQENSTYITRTTWKYLFTIHCLQSTIYGVLRLRRKKIDLNVGYYKVNFLLGVESSYKLFPFFKVNSEFIPLPRNMEFDIINTP